MSPLQLDGLALLVRACHTVPAPGAVALGVEGRGRGLDPVAVLAEHVIAWHAHDSDSLVAAVADLTSPEDAPAIASWAVEAAYQYRRMLAAKLDSGRALDADLADPGPVAAVDTNPGLRWLDDDADQLAGVLPLLDLATDLAGRLPHGLAVGTCSGAAGGWSRPGLVLLDPDKHDLAGTWAHELAHQLDPDYAKHGHAASERFAEVLAPLLIRHEPATVAAAAPHVAVAVDARPPVLHERPGWPAPTWDNFHRAFDTDLRP